MTNIETAAREAAKWWRARLNAPKDNGDRTGGSGRGDKCELAEEWAEVGAGVFINTNLLGAVMMSAPESGLVQIAELKPGGQVILCAGDWVGVVMPHSTDSEPEHGPKFEGLAPC